MKKTIALLALLCAALLLLCSCTPADTNNTTGTPNDATGDVAGNEGPKDYTGTFRVGFGRVDITPELGIGLAGMGDDATRLANKVESPLYMTVSPLPTSRRTLCC